MSYVDEEHEKSYVITYKELVFTFAIFCMILFVLFPKDLLKEQILAESSNYDLSMLYLKNLLKHSPEDESLMLILAEQSLRANKKDLSLRLLELLLKSENIEYRNKATVLSYELQKEDYFYLKDLQEKQKQKAKLKKLFMSIYVNKMYEEEEDERWYEESLFVGADRASYYFLKKRLAQKPYDVELLKEAYYRAKKLKKREDALKYVKALQKYDVKERESWVFNEYYTYIDFKEYNEAEKMLAQRAKDSPEWMQRYAEFSLMQKEYKKSSQIYIELYNESNVYKKKTEYYLKAIAALQSGNKLEAAAGLAHKYERNYLNNRVVRSKLLKIYMATGRLDYASSLSKKILNKEFR